MHTNINSTALPFFSGAHTFAQSLEIAQSLEDVAQGVDCASHSNHGQAQALKPLDTGIALERVQDSDNGPVITPVAPEILGKGMCYKITNLFAQDQLRKITEYVETRPHKDLYYERKTDSL